MKKENIRYFIIASLVMYFVPAVITFLAIRSNSILVIAMPVMVFIFAFVFGRLFPSWEKIDEPDSRAALYAPAFIHALILPLIYILAEPFSEHEGVQIIMFLPYLWSLSFFYIFDLDGGEILTSIIFSVSAVLYGLFFVWGERSAAKKWGIKRDKFKTKYIAVLAVYFAVFCGGVAYHDYYRELTSVTAKEYGDDYYRALYGGGNDNGYGFAYEGGWSSVDLKPYYVENPENKLAKLDEPASLIISDVSQMPVLDGAEATYPVYSAFANACYENIAEIQKYAKSKEGREKNAPRPVGFTNTIEAYKSLIDGDVDIFFGSMPSPEQKKLAEDAEKELVYTPIGKEAFVFFVSEDNPVDGLTSEQVRDIYSGKITNWRKVGGKIFPYLPFSVRKTPVPKREWNILWGTFR